LWAHYGGGHSGLCLGFDVSAMGFSEPDAREVEYVAAPRFRELFLSLVEELGEFVKPWEKGRTYPDEVGDAFYTRQIAKITHENLFVKSEKWKYEEEFRIVMDPSGLHSFDPRSLREIIFGTKTRRRRHQASRRYSKRFGLAARQPQESKARARKLRV